MTLWDPKQEEVISWVKHSFNGKTSLERQMALSNLEMWLRVTAEKLQQEARDRNGQ